MQARCWNVSWESLRNIAECAVRWLTVGSACLAFPNRCPLECDITPTSDCPTTWNHQCSWQRGCWSLLAVEQSVSVFPSFAPPPPKKTTQYADTERQPGRFSSWQNDAEPCNPVNPSRTTVAASVGALCRHLQLDRRCPAPPPPVSPT